MIIIKDSANVIQDFLGNIAVIYFMVVVRLTVLPQTMAESVFNSKVVQLNVNVIQVDQVNFVNFNNLKNL
jgi:hypothetical protein